jgi:hypothetical protein
LVETISFGSRALQAAAVDRASHYELGNYSFGRRYDRNLGQFPELRYAVGMKTHSIEVDEATATTLKTRAAERGVSVSELVAELVTLDGEPIAVDASEIAELDRRWKAIEDGRATVPNTEVVRWLRTCGTPAFRRWHER